MKADNPFWDFSCDYYAKPKVEQTCLRLQNQAKLNVNFILFCIWYADSGRGKLSKEYLKNLIKSIQPWQNHLVENWRNLRRATPKFHELYEIFKKEELVAESVIQKLLYDSCMQVQQQDCNKVTKKESIAHNLENYFNASHITINSRYFHDIHILVTACLK